MKTTLKAIMGILVLALTALSCQEEPKKENQSKEIVFEAPKQIISLEEADSLYVNYKKRRIPSILAKEAEHKEDMDFVPTEFVSFNIEVLKNYIAYVEQEAKNGGAKADSLRIYLGNYGNRSEKYKNKNTIFMLPTANVNGDYGGIYIDSEGKAKLVREWVKEQHKGTPEGQQKSEASIVPSFSSAPNLKGGTSLTLNRSGSSPPPDSDF